jgi:tRNA A37 threonylcarbamoyladenosine dehydratase
MDILLVGVGGLGGEYLYALLRSPPAQLHAISTLCIVDPVTISTHTVSRHPL